MTQGAAVATCRLTDGRTAARTFHPRYAGTAKGQVPGGYAPDALSGAMWRYPAGFAVPFGAAPAGTPPR